MRLHKQRAEVTHPLHPLHPDNFDQAFGKTESVSKLVTPFHKAQTLYWSKFQIGSGFYVALVEAYGAIEVSCFSSLSMKLSIINERTIKHKWLELSVEGTADRYSTHGFETCVRKTARICKKRTIFGQYEMLNLRHMQLLFTTFLLRVTSRK